MKLTVVRGVLALLLLTGLVYANSLGGGFLLDDEEIYVSDPGMYTQTVQSAFSSHPPKAFPNRKGFHYYRPVTILAHSWLLRLFGLQPFGLHFASIALHAAAGVFVFLLMLRLTEIWSAWLAAALFVVHPLHVEAVAWMSALPELLAGVLVLLSLYTLRISDFGLRIANPSGCNPQSAIRNPQFLAVSYLAAALAFFTKETAIVQPLLAAALVGWRAWPFFGIAGGALCLRYVVIGSSTAHLPPRPFWSQAYLMAAAVLHYVRKTVWPRPLAAEYDLAHPLLAWVIFALACVLFAWLAIRHPRVRLALLLFAIPLGPAVAASLVLPGMRQAQDRYAYLAVLGFALLLVYAARGRAARSVAILLIVAWSALTINANRYWGDPETLWSHTLQVTPASRNAILGLGEWYFATQRLADADRIYRQGLALHPNDPEMLASCNSIRKLLRPSQQ